MDRRTYLKTGAIFTVSSYVSGCVAIENGRSTKRPSTMEDGQNQKVVIQQTDEVVANDVEINVGITRERITAESPALVEVEFINTSDRNRDFNFGPYPPFSVIRSIETSPRILLLNSNHSYDPKSQGCWVPNLKRDDEIMRPSKIENVSLSSTERITRIAQIWGSHQNIDTECVPHGEFRFENEYQFDRGFTWGFTLSITRH